MLATTAHNLVQNFDKTCDSVIQNCEPIIITRSNDNNVVLISQAEYDNLMKNLYSHKEKTNKLSILYDGEKINNSLLSESSLSKDWLSEEENTAWQDL
ncbi:MAG: type II toxin-antitoxin system Phd/YefM family antitoxin [Lachnospiraceae bacterium]|jgi:antitoxin YefM|nr:prevent-host-death family protein [Lachnospiraceae bacterium A4]